MSLEKHEDDCPGCKPALLDIKTGQRLPNDDPRMIVINKVWAGTTRAEREAFHRVTCLNSRAIPDLRVMERIAAKFQKAIAS
jgi:hypothetical protein